MKYTDGGVKTYRDVNEASKNAALLIKAGYISQLSAGVYTILPLGLRVINKISEIVRQEMEKANGVELLMPVLQPKENWEKTGRWDAMDDLYRFKSYYSETESALGPTHEEVITPLAKNLVSSYKDLPLYLYQIQTKFRDEKRAKSGLLRGKEFLMKDLYSFHTDEKDLDEYYEIMKVAYTNVFQKVGLGNITYLTYASGGSFSKFSHEFQTVSEIGEDTIYLCEKCQLAVNEEIIEDQKVCPSCGKKDFKKLKAIEVGNIFKLKTKYSEPFGLEFTDQKGKRKPVVMGCYGIGISRLMGTVAEVLSDKKGLIWPKNISPFDIHLIDLDGKQKEVEEIYSKLTDRGVEVFWDNRTETAGVKLADADLMGITDRMVVSKKTIAAAKVEVKTRDQDSSKLVTLDEYLKSIS